MYRTSDLMGSKRTLLAGAVAASLVLASPRDARAEADPFGAALVAVAEAIRNLNFYSQLQAGLFAVSADDLRPGGVGARAGFNALGFGGSLGARMERYRAGAGALALADFEFRPLPFLRSNFYRVIDPFATAGLEIGGGDAGLRVTQTLGAGVDFGLFGCPYSNRELVQPVLSVRYQYRLWQIPDGEPDHLILIGASTRLVF